MLSGQTFRTKVLNYNIPSVCLPNFLLCAIDQNLSSVHIFLNLQSNTIHSLENFSLSLTEFHTCNCYVIWSGLASLNECTCRFRFCSLNIQQNWILLNLHFVLSKHALVSESTLYFCCFSTTMSFSVNSYPSISCVYVSYMQVGDKFALKVLTRALSNVVIGYNLSMHWELSKNFIFLVQNM